jgi:hypothetical protein
MADLDLNAINNYANTASGVSITDFPTALTPEERRVLEEAGRIQEESFSSNPTSSKGSYVPSIKQIYHLKEKILQPALTSHFQCWFDLPPPIKGQQSVADWIKKYRGLDYFSNKELISLSCSEASLPGSLLMTNEINDDHTGVTERHAYRRQYDERSDFTFYIDYGRNDGNYNVLWFFEQWMQYIVNEQYVEGLDDNNYFYRVNFPKTYQGSIIINKFERDFLQNGGYLEYKFLNAYPINITSIPVSYESSQLLKCTVSFTYIRYIARRRKINIQDSDSQVPGIPSTSNVNPNSGIKDNLAIWALSNQKMIDNQNVSRTGNYLDDQKQILARAREQYPPGSPQRQELLRQARQYNPNVNF